MIVLEGLVFITTFYLLGAISFYLYSVLKVWELTDIWDFSIRDGYVSGICEYPKWLLGWAEPIYRKFDERRNKNDV